MIRLLIVILFFSSGAWAANPNCSSRSWEELKVKFCMGAPAAGDSENLIVYFHGLGGNEREWFDKPAMKDIQKTLLEKGFDPWIITVSFGPGWLLTEVPGSYELFSKTLDQILPDIERQIRPAGFKKKFLIGASMGGFNTSQVLLKRSSAFDKYMLICPAITSVGPFSSNAEVTAYIFRTGANPRNVGFMIEWGTIEFPDVLEWNKHSPLILADRVFMLPEVYISCGLRDEFGFQEGAEALYRKISAKSKRSMWIPIPQGRHCSYDKDSIIDFLLAN
jgi:Predicted hydrolase of the alpha/beta superfamily